MDWSDAESMTRLLVIAFSVYSAALALFAWRLTLATRVWGAACMLSVAAYAGCTSGRVMLVMPIPIPMLIYFLCAALPAFFWAFVAELFDDDDDKNSIRITVVVFVGLLGLLAGLLPDLLAAMSSVLRRVIAVCLVGFTLWSLWRGLRNDLINARIRARLWLLGVAGLYVLVVLGVELLMDESNLPASLPAINLLAIALICLVTGVLLTRWEMVIAEPGTQTHSVERQSALISPSRREPQPDTSDRLIDQLEEAMSRDRLYRQERLTIASLAAHLNTPEYRLRSAINRRLGYRNYNEFLHHYRLTEAADRLRDPAEQNTPVLTIALEVGYGSIGPFNRAFKARYEQTPTQFRERPNQTVGKLTES